MGIKLTEREMKYIALFESITGTTAKDCVIDDAMNRIIFLVKPGQAGLAVGRNGVNVRRLRELFKKDVEIVEYADSIEQLIKNSLFPARVIAVKVTNTQDKRKVAYVSVHPSDKGLAIGKEGRNILRARLLAKRYFDVDRITIV